MTQTNDEVKNKIKEIVERNHIEGLCWGNGKDTNRHLVIDELATLYTEMVEGELREFAKWYDDEYFERRYADSTTEEYLLKRTQEHI